MREVIRSQLGLGELPIGEIKLNTKSRDDIPKLLIGLQHIYVTPALREEVFTILKEVIPKRRDGTPVAASVGRPGMDQWKILVLGVVRLGLNIDYDRLQELADQHLTLRQMLGHGAFDDTITYDLQTLKDNLYLFTPEILGRINEVVVRAGHRLLKKKPEENLRGRCDSFVVETNVHYPTDTNLLLDAIRKVIKESARLCEAYDLTLWRQSEYHLRQFKRQYRIFQQKKRSTSKDEAKRDAKQTEIDEACARYLQLAESHLERVNQMKALLPQVLDAEWKTLDSYVAHAERQIDQVRRRILQHEVIPHAEKVFSIFQPHTEWVSKGKAGVPVELGVRVCIVEDQHRFILHHRVMEKQTDDQVAVEIVKETRRHFPSLNVVSFDQGFHSMANRKALEAELDLVAMRKKGRLSAADKERESEPDFVKARRQHSAVESAINGLEHGGLDICPDHGIKGFKRYVAMAVLARNVQRLGAVVRDQEREKEKQAQAKSRRSQPLAKAA